MTPHQQIRLSAKRQSLDCLYNCLENVGTMPVRMIAEIIDQIEDKVKEIEKMEASFNA